MTVAQAISLYTESGRSAVSPALREIVRQMIDKNIKTEFSNDSYYDALYLTDVMFGRAEANVRLLTGPGADGFLLALQKSFIAMLDRLQATRGSVRIILLSSELPEWLGQVAKKYVGTLEIFLAHSVTPIKHFIVCDSRMARLEELHDLITPESKADEIKASVYFNEPTKTKVFEQHFDSIWTSLAKLGSKQKAKVSDPVPA